MASTESVVLVPVSAAEPVVAPVRAELDASAARGVPAHVTVLYPFVPPDEFDDVTVRRLAAVIARVSSFHSSFDRVEWFGDDVVYLAPRDDSPFRALTSSVAAEFGLRPYAGRFGDDVVPHLTLGHGSPRPRLDAAAAQVAAALPIDADIAEAALMTGGDAPDSWTVHTRLRLGPPRR